MAALRQVLFVILVVASRWPRPATGAVIPPPWGDPQVNPCASVSWQYLYWKPDGQCYPIFKQGPCPASHELVFDAQQRVAKCQCPSDRVYWAEDQRCYQPYTTGPCSEDSFLHPGKEMNQRGPRPEPHRRTLLQVQAWLQGQSPKMEPLAMVHCKRRGSCQDGWAFWPATELCYPLYSQGPCHSGSLFYWNSRSQQAQCGCAEQELRNHFWPISATCHEHFSQGPCKVGQVFTYDNATQATQCWCSPRLRHYHAETGQCYEKFTRGPCKSGMWLTSAAAEMPQYSLPADEQKAVGPTGERQSTGDGESSWLTCSCLPGHVYSIRDNQCYREFTQGPCKSGHFLVAKERAGVSRGVCIKNPCGRHELYFPGVQRCYQLNSRGPCPFGQIVVGDDQHGIGYRGRCGCSAVNSQNYWSEDGRCYQLETTGPCVVPLVFNMRSTNGLTPQCSCPVDHVFHNESQKCYKEFTQGPCDWNEWLVPVYQSVLHQELDAGDEPPLQHVCQCKPGYEYQSGSSFCQPPSVELLMSLNRPSLPPRHLRTKSPQQRVQRRTSSLRRRPPIQ